MGLREVSPQKIGFIGAKVDPIKNQKVPVHTGFVYLCFFVVCERKKEEGPRVYGNMLLA